MQCSSLSLLDAPILDAPILPFLFHRCLNFKDAAISRPPYSFFSPFLFLSGKGKPGKKGYRLGLYSSGKPFLSNFSLPIAQICICTIPTTMKIIMLQFRETRSIPTQAMVSKRYYSFVSYSRSCIKRGV